MSIKLEYHKLKLRQLMRRYYEVLDSVDCGYELAKNLISDILSLENKMDTHIQEINRLDNKSFKLFSEGYRPSGIIN